MSTLAVNCALGAWAAAAAGSDLRHRRVPNALLLTLLLPVLLLLLWQGRGPLGAGPVYSLLGLCAAAIPLLPGYLLGLLGAGDVKLAACLGLVLGGGAAFEMVLVGCLLLGLASGLVLLRGGAARRIPAAPAFAAAFALQLLFGPQLA